ncbi:MAG TPA: DUF5818 domain-containing protein [Bryobacteraceae bacterium]|nr:DUF5818 domain-containing protein [Bryobacteraceae bacterium]
MKPLILGVLIVAASAAAQGTRQFTGTITDSMCERGDHSRMRMGPTDGECTVACVEAHGASYVLWDGKETYTLSDQKAPEKFAGKKVKVTGTLDAATKTIRVEAISEAK